MQIVEMNINEVIPYEKNPRKNEAAVKYVANSIKEFGFKVPIVIDENNVIVAGHTRLKAAKKLKLETVPCVIADDLSEDQIKAFRLADNKVSEKAEWDFDLLGDEMDDLLDIFNMEDFGFEFEDEEPEEMYQDARNDENLQERFLCPPFSVIDGRQGYYRARKRAWIEMGIESENGRKDDLLGNGLAKLSKNSGRGELSGTSIFDPALCELCYKWFNIDGGTIYDCFAGGSVRGIVAAKLGYKYKGIDLRREQIDANYENASRLDVEVEWYCDDSQNVDLYVEDNSVDMIFSCPPYADLEVYSDDPRDISNMEYSDFVRVYRNIIAKACNKLKEDRFAVFVVGEVRDKNGNYYDFVGDTKKAFMDAGLHFYNDMVLLDPLGTAALRAGKIFMSGRKVCKVHQNVLVFYKGNPKNIKDNFGEIEVMEISEESIDE